MMYGSLFEFAPQNHSHLVFGSLNYSLFLGCAIKLFSLFVRYYALNAFLYIRFAKLFALFIRFAKLFCFLHSLR